MLLLNAFTFVYPQILERDTLYILDTILYIYFTSNIYFYVYTINKMGRKTWYEIELRSVKPRMIAFNFPASIVSGFGYRTTITTIATNTAAPKISLYRIAISLEGSLMFVSHTALLRARNFLMLSTCSGAHASGLPSSRKSVQYPMWPVFAGSNGVQPILSHALAEPRSSWVCSAQ